MIALLLGLLLAAVSLTIFWVVDKTTKPRELPPKRTDLYYVTAPDGTKTPVVVLYSEAK